MTPPSPRGKKRVFIVDDHPIVRQGLTNMINREPDLVVQGEAEDASQTLKAVKMSKPDVLIVDLSLDGTSSLGLIESLKAAHPAIPILVLSVHDESLYAERAFRAGAQGYIMKREASDRVLSALREVLRGGFYASDFLKAKMFRKLAGPSSRAGGSPVETLSNRELEVFEMIGRGLGTRQIAEKLCVSIKTVESYRAHIKEKLNLESASQLVREAVQWIQEDISRRPPS